jgi:hypothetical protein
MKATVRQLKRESEALARALVVDLMAYAATTRSYPSRPLLLGAQRVTMGYP